MFTYFDADPMRPKLVDVVEVRSPKHRYGSILQTVTPLSSALPYTPDRAVHPWLCLGQDYWDLMPKYQGVSPSALQFKRVLCGFFPTFRRSPLKTHFDRICSIGAESSVVKYLHAAACAC
jgi:hypothetical protein